MLFTNRKHSYQQQKQSKEQQQQQEQSKQCQLQQQISGLYSKKNNNFLVIFSIVIVFACLLEYVSCVDPLGQKGIFQNINKYIIKKPIRSMCLYIYSNEQQPINIFMFSLLSILLIK